MVWAVLLVQITLNAQDSTQTIVKKIYTTQFLKEVVPPEIDGVLDDNCWDIAEWAGDFIEQRPDENTAPDHQTKFKIIYDRKFL